jgi:exodeoxyribonuclease X
MTFLAIDIESTGIPAEGELHGIMEAGRCRLKNGIIKRPESVLVDCGIPVSIGARATHHISDEMVAGKIGPSQACAWLMEEDNEYFAAHVADFDRKFFGGGERQFICTYKTALRLWPDAPGHKLMELRYFLDLDKAEDFDPALAEPVHRAAADSYVCAHLLRRILQEAAAQKIDIDRLVKWSGGPALLHMCFLRKHKGKPWYQVAQEDRPYLEWIYTKSDITDRDIRATVKYYLNKH